MDLKLHTFMKAVTTAGTQEVLTSLTRSVMSVVIQAESTNTGIIYVGESSVSSASYGTELAAGDSIAFKMQDFGSVVMKVKLDSIWLDCSVNGDGVSVLYLSDDS